MKTTIAIAVTAVAIMAANAPAQAQMAGLKSADAAIEKSNLVQQTKRRRRRGRVAAGIALGVLGAAAAAHAYQNDYYRDRRYSRHERRCRRWRRWCNRGEGDACWKYDNRC